jgi:CO/xanthine dehydrogenase Mo-binding subunit
MKIYLLQERHKWSNNVIFASESLDKVIDIVKQKYKIDDEDIQYLIEWKEFYNILEDVKITIEEIELDKLTGEVRVIEFNSVVDCGTPINPNLARVQAEGGILQGIGMALTENVTYNKYGKLAENSLMQYKIPTRWDIGHINVEFEASYEGSGPFGAKSIGEVVINTPGPAIADAIYNATGKRFYELPITPEKIIMG